MKFESNLKKLTLLALSTLLMSTQGCAQPSTSNLSTLGWTSHGDISASYVDEKGHSGKNSVGQKSDRNYSVETVRILNNIKDGEYILRAYVQSSGGQDIAELITKNCGGADSHTAIPKTVGKSDYWTMLESQPINVTGGKCTVGVKSKGTSTQWLLADDFELLPKPEAGKAPTEMKVGGDVTTRNLVYSVGGKWADQNGTEKDILSVLQENSFNLARIRIYNKPGAPVELSGKTYRVQDGYQDLNDAVKTAKAAKEHGMTLFISLHYSDFWTNPALQTVPQDWKGLEGEALEKALYDYTYNVMTTLKSNNVVPEFISIGNEINDGMSGVMRGEAYYKLLQKGYEAVKAVSPQTKVVIHLTVPNKEFYDAWIDDAKKYGLNYDLIGASMYPFWTNMTIGEMAGFVSHIAQYSGKHVMICEVGYPWTLESQFGKADLPSLIVANNLDPDGPENYGATPEGQLKYMKEYFRTMYNTGVVEGISYWDPIAIDVKGAGWVVGENIAVEDTSFFDYQTPHRALESIKAFYSY
ncbi:arabinogalactan endo-1,4-beta-galactosidase [Citrobacter portucalensis]|uniref:glycosyl hydrolase 53 family protein n=1 Tax=Citrobacter portucalensis TaxID=1639133 RepID=UPI00226B51CF|nr:glycosyl hydrolase 53 family protein [Citrobacter portucalensis]MCX9024063.1 arabinogalactan endo-1,4-beta-galactosidase [Citrobacter portucalensis]MCX9061476.1 arabinogalactan endo-1,4-beta-galactosidase [Citrobacter portucalensis]